MLYRRHLFHSIFLVIELHNTEHFEDRKTYDFIEHEAKQKT